MTFTRPRRPSPRPNFARIPRARFEQHCAALEAQAARAKGETRAMRDWIACWLEQTAARYERNGHGVIAAELRTLIDDFEKGPE